MSKIVGFDIGGANLKAAVAKDGALLSACEVPMPLWKGLDQLDRALGQVKPFCESANAVAITMTGELCELFQTRREGVASLVTHMEKWSEVPCRFFMGLKGFGTAITALADPDSVASANFLATARIVAAKKPKSLLIDFGSTTTDIIVCDRPQGLTDAERLQTGELVYTGLTRTPVPSVTTRAPLLGHWQGLARDTFATMADVRRVLGPLQDITHAGGTADGRGTSQDECLKRFARGFGRDGEMRHLEGWQAAARYIREVQLNSILEGAMQVLSRPNTNVTGVVAAGIGEGEVRFVAQRLGLPVQSFADVIGAPAPIASDVTRFAPAAAVALLASELLRPK